MLIATLTAVKVFRVPICPKPSEKLQTVQKVSVPNRPKCVRPKPSQTVPNRPKLSEKYLSQTVPNCPKPSQTVPSRPVPAPIFVRCDGLGRDTP